MPDDAPLYRDLLRFRPEGLTLNAWAVRAGVSRTVWADMRRHGNPSRRTLERLLSAAGSSIAEFEALRVGGEMLVLPNAAAGLADPAAAWTHARSPALPLVAASLVGEFRESGDGIALIRISRDEIIGRLPRPQSLAGDAKAYAIAVVAESMWPRFRPGAHIAISPQASIAVGDDVVVTLRASANRNEAKSAVIGQLLGRTNDSVELRQFNPDRSFSVGNETIDAIEKIAGELI